MYNQEFSCHVNGFTECMEWLKLPFWQGTTQYNVFTDLLWMTVLNICNNGQKTVCNSAGNASLENRRRLLNLCETDRGFSAMLGMMKTLGETYGLQQRGHHNLLLKKKNLFRNFMKVRDSQQSLLKDHFIMTNRSSNYCQFINRSIGQIGQKLSPGIWNRE